MGGGEYGGLDVRDGEVREAGTDEGGGGFELLGFLSRELFYLGKLFGSVRGFAGGGGAGG